MAVHNVFLGFILLVCSHTFLLHCWSNCWGELLGFADCTFYEVPTILIQLCDVYSYSCMYSGKLSNPDIEWGRKMSL